MHLIKEQAKICASRVAKKRKIVREHARLFGTREYLEMDITVKVLVFNQQLRPILSRIYYSLSSELKTENFWHLFCTRSSKACHLDDGQSFTLAPSLLEP